MTIVRHCIAAAIIRCLRAFHDDCTTLYSSCYHTINALIPELLTADAGEVEIETSFSCIDDCELQTVVSLDGRDCRAEVLKIC